MQHPLLKNTFSAILIFIYGLLKSMDRTTLTATDTLFTKNMRKRLDVASPTPLYHQLFVLLKGLILDGTLILSQQMPTEEQLAQIFSVSRITAKRAMDELGNENLVERRRGKGTHVVYEYKPKPVQAPLTGMLQEIETMARNSRAIIHLCDLIQPPQVIRDEFGLSVGETALHLVRVREREGHKFGRYVSWTHGVDIPDDPNIFVNTPRLSYFRQNGLEVTHVTQTLSATEANHETAQALDMQEGRALLSLVRRSYNRVDSEEQLIDYLEVLYNPERFQYAMDLKLE